MSGVLSIPSTFQNAVTATGLQLDQDFNTITAYVNDPTNRNNFATDGTATNTVNLTFSPAVAGGYTAGLELTWKWGVTNTGGTLLNANGLGNIALLNPDGSALVGGQGVVGSIGKAVYDGTRAIYLNPPMSATKAQMQTATASTGAYVTPAQAQNHPGVAKAWVTWNGTVAGTQTVTTNGYNVSTVSRTGTGSYIITFVTPFSNGNYAGVATPQGAGGVIAQKDQSVTQSTASTGILVAASSTAVPADVSYISFVAFGTQ